MSNCFIRPSLAAAGIARAKWDHSSNSWELWLAFYRGLAGKLGTARDDCEQTCSRERQRLPLMAAGWLSRVSARVGDVRG
jgi:hypothetical protein